MSGSAVGVTPSLPVQGIEMILGNDLAGGPNPCASDGPICSDCDPVEANPDLFSACAVTCAMAKKVQVQPLPDRGGRVNKTLEEIVTPRYP